MHTEQHRTAKDELPGMQSQHNRIRAQATRRLFLAVVNQAISDVLENGKEAKEARRWLLSKDFDALDKLFAFPTKRGKRHHCLTCGESHQLIASRVVETGFEILRGPGESRIFGVLPAFGQSNDQG